MRDKMAAALALTVEDITLDPHEFEPRTLSAFQAWPVWVSSAWLTRCARTTTWAVLVLLPAGDAEAWTDAADALVDPIRDALETLGHVELVEPVTVSAQDAAGLMPALRFTLTTPGS